MNGATVGDRVRRLVIAWALAEFGALVAVLALLVAILPLAVILLPNLTAVLVDGDPTYYFPLWAIVIDTTVTSVPLAVILAHSALKLRKEVAAA